MDESVEGQDLDQSTITPTLRIEDLKIDRTKLTMFGQGIVSGINNQEELDAVLRRDLSHLNRIFSNEGLANKLIDESTRQIGVLDSATELNEEQMSSREVLSVLREFGKYARNKDKVSALLALERVSKESLQDAIARSEGLTMASFRDIDLDTSSVTKAFLELSKIKYASKHEGKPYRTLDEGRRIKEAQERGEKLRIS